MTLTGGYRRGRSLVSALHVHVVFVTKYRHGGLRSEHLDHLEDVFAHVCSDFGATLVETNGEDDHIHLLVEYPPTVTISALVNSLKGVSSRRLRQRFEMRTHLDHLWSPSYLAASAGGPPLSIVRQYVEAQRRSAGTAPAYPALKDRACASKALSHRPGRRLRPGCSR